MTKAVSLADAKARFSAIIDDVARSHEHYIIERRGRAVAAIVGVEELERLEAGGSTGGRPAGALALVGLWADVDDSAIDAFVQDIYEARDRDLDRSVRMEP